MTKRFLLCICSDEIDCFGALIGNVPIERSQAVEPEGFDSPEDAFRIASVFPGEGHAFVYDTERACVTHGVRWRQRGASN